MIDLLLFPLVIALAMIEALLPYLPAVIIGGGLGLLLAALVIFQGTWEARKTHKMRDYLDGKLDRNPFAE